MTAEGSALTIILDPAAVEALRAAVAPMGRGPMSAAEFATYSGLSKRTISRCLSSGLPRIKVGRAVRIEPGPAMEWLRNNAASIRRRRQARLS